MMAKLSATLLLTLAAPTAFAADAGSPWVAVGSMTTVRWAHTATLLPSGQVLVAGGSGDGGTLSSAELFDPTTGTWSDTSSMATARFYFTATLLTSGKVLVVGGSNENGAVADSELYDPVAGNWSSTGALAEARWAHTATLLPSGEVLVTGGSGAASYELTSAEVYDPISGNWSPTGSMATGRQSPGTALLPNGQVLVAGGTVVYPADSMDPLSGIPTANAELYDPATRAWADAGFLTAANLEPCATVLLDGSVLVAGGWTLMLPNPTPKNAAVYDSAQPGWSATGSTATGGWFSSLTALSSGRALAAGGANFVPVPDSANYAYVNQADAELYDPDAGCWTVTGPMSTPRMQHTATLLPNGGVLVVGGWAQFLDGPVASAEVYTEPSELAACVVVADAGTPDAGSGVDTGAPDGGDGPDAGGSDAGSSLNDAGPGDAGKETILPKVSQSCGCTSFGGEIFPLLSLAVLAFFKRVCRWRAS
jgi:hypothetical protein